MSSRFASSVVPVQRSVSSSRATYLWMLKPHGPPVWLKRIVCAGRTISAVHPVAVRRVATSQIPSQSSEALSALGSEIRPSSRAPAALTSKRYPVRWSWNVSSTIEIVSSPRMSPSRCIVWTAMRLGSGSMHVIPK